MPKHDLVDVDVESVHFVANPANKRRFAIIKNLSGHRPQEDTMSPEDAERLERVEKAYAALIQRDLDQRVARLRKAGVEVPDDATPEVLAAVERVAADFFGKHYRNLERVGLLKAFGDNGPSRRETGLREIVAKSAARGLDAERARADSEGVHPVLLEAVAKARARLKIYRANPGLLTQVVKEERQRAARGEL